MCPKDAEGIANSVGPDQTAPRSSLIWVCTVCPGLSVRKLRIITVVVFTVTQPIICKTPPTEEEPLIAQH